MPPINVHPPTFAYIFPLSPRTAPNSAYGAPNSRVRGCLVTFYPVMVWRPCDLVPSFCDTLGGYPSSACVILPPRPRTGPRACGSPWGYLWIPPMGPLFSRLPPPSSIFLGPLSGIAVGQFVFLLWCWTLAQNGIPSQFL